MQVPKSIFSDCSIDRARKRMVFLWFGFLALNISVISWLYFKGWIGPENFHKALAEISTLYSVYCGTILAFYFGTNKKIDAKKNDCAGIEYQLAIFVTLLWNVLLSVFFILLLFDVGSIEKAIENIKFISSVFSWLVAVVIGYYFATTGDTADAPAQNLEKKEK